MFLNLMMVFISGIISRILCSWRRPLKLYVLKSSKFNCPCHRKGETYEINPSMSLAHGSVKCARTTPLTDHKRGRQSLMKDKTSV